MEKLIVKTMEIIKFDLSKELAFTGLECLQTMLKQIGPQIGCVPSLKESIIAVIKTVFNSKVNFFFFLNYLLTPPWLYNVKNETFIKFIISFSQSLF